MFRQVSLEGRPLDRFSLYQSEQLVVRHGFLSHQYTDDTQIYASCKPHKMSHLAWRSISVISVHHGLRRIDSGWTPTRQKPSSFILLLDAFSAINSTTRNHYSPAAFGQKSGGLPRTSLILLAHVDGGVPCC